MKNRRIFSLAAASAALLLSTSAHADDWGCEVLLCLSNPAGPMAVSECVPPITRLYKAIFKTKPDPFPTCAMARSPDGSNSWATPNYADYYDPCPDGTQALSEGVFAAQASRQVFNQVMQSSRWKVFAAGAFGGPTSVGIGEGSQLRPGGEDNSLPTKTCVSGFLGNANMIVPGYGDSEGGGGTLSVGIYERVTYIQPQFNGLSIRVFINDKLYQVVRPKL